jgi:hypothetical protein
MRPAATGRQCADVIMRHALRRLLIASASAIEELGGAVPANQLRALLGELAVR